MSKQTSWFRYGWIEASLGGYVPPDGLLPRLLYWLGHRANSCGRLEADEGGLEVPTSPPATSQRAQIERLTAQNTETAAFLDTLAAQMDIGASWQHSAADCRAMAAKLRALEGK
jgi:hypothetical protein